MHFNAHMHWLFQEAYVMPAGITTTDTASTCRRRKRCGKEPIDNAGQTTRTWPALATRQKWTSSKASREDFVYEYNAEKY